jgi:hypothetical protein
MQSAKPFRWFVMWGLPHQEPPDGQPRVLCEVGADNRECPREITELKEALGYGSGWVIAFDMTPVKRKRWSLEAKQRVRRKRLRARLEKRYPMFADEFEQEAYKRKPEYYGVDPGA